MKERAMRITALIGLGFPVLIVSGAVAYGAILEITKDFDAGPIVQVQAPGQVPIGSTTRAMAFVAAGKADWAVAQTSPLVVSQLQEQPTTGAPPQEITPSAPEPSGTRSSDNNPPVERVSDRDANPPAAIVRRPVQRAGAQVRSPNSNPSPNLAPVEKTRFKMPWQTGIYQ